MKNGNYIIAFILSFIFGWLYYSKENSKKNSYLNKTFVLSKEGRFYIVFKSVVPLTREITEQEYNNFVKDFPNKSADGNLIDKYSKPSKKYTKVGDKYYEHSWDGNDYDNGIEITKDEYIYFTNKSRLPLIEIDVI